MKPNTATKSRKQNRRVGPVKGLCLFVFLAAILVLCGFLFLYFNGLSGVYADSEPAKNQIRVACVGDSITYGHGVKNWPKNNYPAVLSRLLGGAYHVQNFGVSGSTVQEDGDQPYTADKRCRQSLDYNADILILMMGSNDSKPENWKNTAQFEQQYNQLIDRYARGENPPQIYLCTPAKPYYTNGKTDGLMQFDISGEQVEAIAASVQKIAQQRQLECIDIYSLTATHPEWFEKDGVHPNANGAAAIAAEIKKGIVQ